MSYLLAMLNHVRAVQSWTAAHGGHANLDLSTCQLEVKALHRYFTLFPQFVASTDGRLAHVATLSPNVFGFIGWMPYRPVRWPLSTDKLAFKQLLAREGVRTPGMWPSPSEAASDYVVKQSVGSFGLAMAGPFRRGTAAPQEHTRALRRPDGQGEVYAEQFIAGRNLKAWFWGSTVFHLQLHEYPTVTADGERTVRGLASDKLARQGLVFETYKELPFVLQALSYQGLGLDDVPLPRSAALAGLPIRSPFPACRRARRRRQRAGKPCADCSRATGWDRAAARVGTRPDVRGAHSLFGRWRARRCRRCVVAGNEFESRVPSHWIPAHARRAVRRPAGSRCRSGRSDCRFAGNVLGACGGGPVKACGPDHAP